MSIKSLTETVDRHRKDVLWVVCVVCITAIIAFTALVKANHSEHEHHHYNEHPSIEMFAELSGRLTKAEQRIRALEAATTWYGDRAGMEYVICGSNVGMWEDISNWERRCVQQVDVYEETPLKVVLQQLLEYLDIVVEIEPETTTHQPQRVTITGGRNE